MLKSGEHFEPLGSGIEVIVSRENHFSTDTILLADFAAPKKHENVIELGTGCGTISLLWCRNTPPRHITAVDIQEQAADMLRRSTAHNKLDEYITVINKDLNDLKGEVVFGSFDMCAMNPPYKIGGGGIVNPESAKQIARHETMCTLDDITKTAAKLLRFGGRFCICQRPERLADVLMSMRNAGIEPKKMRLVQQRKSKAPKLFLAEGRRGGSSGGMVVMPTLFIENDNGSLSEEMTAIYGDYKENYL
ncbi:MAG: methyltransferase [Clostridia bacterium]|nr:methyltransferase [Clostridia bacterium]